MCSDHRPDPGHHSGHEALVGEALRYGAAGAVVGSLLALPAAYDETRAGTASVEQATHRVVRAGARAAVATGVGAIAAALVGRNRFLRLATLMVAGGVALHTMTGATPSARTPADS